MRRIIIVAFALAVVAGFAFANGSKESSSASAKASSAASSSAPTQKFVFRYGHENAPNSVAGEQAVHFANLVKQYTNGGVTIQVFPAEQLGNLHELVTMVSSGAIAISHNTMAGMATLDKNLALFDTPYLYKSVKQLMDATNPETSPVMKELQPGLMQHGVRVLYTFYFGTRELTANKPVYKPADLRGVKIRAIPFPIYLTAVEGLGAVAVPVDWSEVPTDLATGVIDGQENPVDTILHGKIYEYNKYIMMTNHIRGAEIVVMNEADWQKLPKSYQTAVEKAAQDTSKWATQRTLDLESSDLKQLEADGMHVIGPKQGLDVQAFRDRTEKLVQQKFGAEWGKYYQQIRAIK